MQLINTKQGKVIVMSFVDAEHCGIELDKLKFESEVSNIDIIKENPIALLIQFDGGFIITKETKKETIEKMHEATKIFNNLIEHIKDKPQKEVSVDSSHN